MWGWRRSREECSDVMQPLLALPFTPVPRRGAFGAVYLGLNDDTGALMAVKELPFSLSDKKEIRKLSAEINLMR